MERGILLGYLHEISKGYRQTRMGGGYSTPQYKYNSDTPEFRVIEYGIVFTLLVFQGFSVISEIIRFPVN